MIIRAGAARNPMQPLYNSLTIETSFYLGEEDFYTVADYIESTRGIARFGHANRIDFKTSNPAIRRLERSSRMRRIIATTAWVLALTMGSAWAGDSKCPYSTQECLNRMAENAKTGGWIGIDVDTDRAEGYLIKSVFENSPAQAAGLQAGDLLYALNGIVIKAANEDKIKTARGDWKPGQRVTYTIKRNGVDREVSVTLARVPVDVMARWIGEHMLEHAQVDLAKGTDVTKK
jgi:hypothetical protein